MKKIILAAFMLLAAVTIKAQTVNPVKIIHAFTYDKDPTVTPPVWSSKITDGDQLLCLLDSSLYAYKQVTKTWYKVIDKKNQKGDTGAQGIPGVNGTNGANATITIGSTTTLPAGSNATVTNSGSYTNAILSFGIPKGADGSGSGAASTIPIWARLPCYQSPEFYGPAHDYKTFAQLGHSQTFIDTAFGGVFKAVGATLSDMKDWACVSAACYNAPVNSLILGYGKYYINRDVRINDERTITFQGGYYEATNNNVWTFFSSTAPGTNGALANKQNLRLITFRDMEINGTGYQDGIEIQGSYGANYNNIKFRNLDDGIICNFQLNMTVRNCYFNAYNRGITAGALIGLDGAFYVSNNVRVEDCQFRGNQSPQVRTEYAFKGARISGVFLERNIAEGFGFKKVFIIDDENVSTVFESRVSYTHFEAVDGISEGGLVTYNVRQGIHTFEVAFGQYPAIMIDATSSTGNADIMIKNVPYWVGNASGKSLKSNLVSWDIEKSQGIFTDKSVALNQFVGNNVVECPYSASRCGYNSLRFYGLGKANTSVAARLQPIPETVECKMVEVGNSMFNGKPSKKIQIVYTDGATEIKRSPVYENYVLGYQAFSEELIYRSLYFN